MSVASISQRLSLRAPQRRSLELLDQLAVALRLPPRDAAESAFRAIKDGDRAAQFDACHAVVPSLASFDRAFPSFTFALATGVGKTRLMGACIARLHAEHDIRDFFVVAPNLTIYDKLRADFTPNTSKYVFEGLAEFATTPPLLVDASNWHTGIGVRGTDLLDRGEVHINLFNIAMFASEEGRRMRTLREMIGEAYFDYLAGLPALALLMDESHRYRAAASARALDDLNPLIGLEFTATPQVQQGQRTSRFGNVVYDYPLAQAIADGFVKRPAVAGRTNFDASALTTDQLDRIKLEDALVLHEQAKAELAAYAARERKPAVKPFVLVIARDTEHAAQLQALVESPAFHGGIYAGRVITVHSGRLGAEKDEVISRLLRVEHADEPTEIVIHVEMLKEGWDVTNLYTIVPLRAANSKTLVEQSIGRGLRLPYGKPTGVPEVDRLSIVAHDRFDEIVRDANAPGSQFRLDQVIIDPDDPDRRVRAVTIRPVIDALLAVPPAPDQPSAQVAEDSPPSFAAVEEQRITQAVARVLDEYRELPTMSQLSAPAHREAFTRRVMEVAQGSQYGLELGISLARAEEIALGALEIIQLHTIEIPRIVLQPNGQTRVSYSPFTLDTSRMRYSAPSEEIVLTDLQSLERRLIVAGLPTTEPRLENYILRSIVDEQDIDYDSHADLLYRLAGEAVEAVRAYALSDQATAAILVHFGMDIGRQVLTQLRQHRLEEPAGFDVRISVGFLPLRDVTRTVSEREPLRNFRDEVSERSRIRQMQFGGFRRALFNVQFFESDPERRFAVLLEDDGDAALKWFRPWGQDLRIYWNGDHRYVPDFIVETSTDKLMVEVKADNEMEDPEVLSKARAAAEWCARASSHAAGFGGKPWRYLLLPEASIVPSATLEGLLQRHPVDAR